MQILTIFELTLILHRQDPSAVITQFIHDPYQAYPMIPHPT